MVDSLQSVSNKLEAKLTTLFKNLRTTLEARFKPPVGLIGKVHEFTVEGVTHTIWLAEQTPGGPLRVMLDGIGDAAKLDLEADLPDGLSAEMRQKVQTAVAAVLKHGGQLRDMLRAKPPKLKEAKALQAKTEDLGLAIAKLAEALVGARATGCWPRASAPGRSCEPRAGCRRSRRSRWATGCCPGTSTTPAGKRTTRWWRKYSSGWAGSGT